MAAIRDSHSPNHNASYIFPPINHENLHRPSPPDHHHHQNPLSPSPSSPSLSSSSSSSLSSFSPSDSDDSGPISPIPSDTQVTKPSEPTTTAATWIGIGVAVLRSKVLSMAASSGFVKLSCFASGAGVAAAVFMLWSFYLRARRRRYRNRLKLIAKEKDEKINKLLHQIAQLNEVLVAKHRVMASKLAN